MAGSTGGAVPGRPPGDARAGAHYRAGGLMAQHHGVQAGRIAHAALGVRVQVRAADPHRLHPHLHLARAGVRQRQLRQSGTGGGRSVRRRAFTREGAPDTSPAMWSSTAWKYAMSRSFSGMSSRSFGLRRGHVAEGKSLRLHPGHVPPAGRLAEEDVATGQLQRQVRGGALAAVIVLVHQHGAVRISSVPAARRAFICGLRLLPCSSTISDCPMSACG